MADYLFVAAIVFLVNVIPAFMPPTWIILSFFYIRGGGDILALALVGTTAATIGRFFLAKGSGIFASRFFPKKEKENLDFVRNAADKKIIEKFFFSFFYSLSPFPSNNLFIVAGASGLGLLSVLAGFFTGRLISYSVLMWTVGKFYGSIESILGSWFSLGTVLFEAFSIITVVLFLFIDWKELIARRKIKFVFPKLKKK